MSTNFKSILLKSSLFVLLCASQSLNAQIKVGDNPNSMNANSMLEVESTDKGVLLPRIALTSTTSFSPLSTHVLGMFVYNTATVNDVFPGIYYNDGSKWVRASVDNLGNHTATQNVRLNGNYLSGDGGNEGVYVANNGNVGIGTNSASGRLTVDGSNQSNPVRISSSADNTYVIFNNSYTGSNPVQLGFRFNAYNPSTTSEQRTASIEATGFTAVNANQLRLSTHDATGNIAFRTGNNNLAMYLDSVGNVGIGTGISLTEKLEVVGRTKTTNFTMTNGATNGYVLQSNASGQATWVDPTSLTVTGDNLGNHTATQNVQLNGNYLSGDGGNEGVYVANNGNVGIGTNSASGRLTVDGSNQSNPVRISSAADDTYVIFNNSYTGSNPVQLGFRFNAYNPSSTSEQRTASIEATGFTAANPNQLRLSTHDATGNIAFRPGNNNLAMYLDSVGNVGIGAGTSLTEKLEVVGRTKTTNFTMTNGATNGYVLQSNASGQATWVDPTSLTVTGDNLGNHTATQNVQLNGNYLSGDGGNEGISVANNGYVGVGTNNPQSLFQVDADVNQTYPVRFNMDQSTQSFLRLTNLNNTANSVLGIEFRLLNSSANNRAGQIRIFGENAGTDSYSMQLGSTNASGDLRLYTGNFNERLRISSTGNVGIGVTAPTEKLEVSGRTKTTNFTMTNGATNGYVLQSNASGQATWVDPTSLTVTGDNLGNHTATQNVQLNGNYLSGDGGNEGLFVANDGNVGIGTNSPGTYALYAQKTGGVQDGFAFVQQNGTTGERDIFTILDEDAAGSSQDHSSSFKVMKTGDIDAGATGLSLAELTYTGATASSNIYYISGRQTDEGATLWGVDLQDNDIWSSGGMSLGVTSNSNGSYSGGNFIVQSNGYTGIGNSSPNAMLQVDADVNQTYPVRFHMDNSQTSYLRLTNLKDTNDSELGIEFRMFNSSSGNKFGQLRVIGEDAGTDSYSMQIGTNNASGDFRIYTGNFNERARISSTGDFGIGETTPLAKLHVNGGIIVDGGGVVASEVGLYKNSGELRSFDASGNTTLLSPHNFSLIPEGRSEEMAWAFHSQRDGKTINADMARMVRLVEQMSGESLIYIKDENGNVTTRSVENSLVDQIEQLSTENQELKKRLLQIEKKLEKANASSTK